MLDKWRNRRIRSTGHTRPPRTGARRHWHRFRRKSGSLAQAGVFAAVRGIAYTLGCAFTAWLIVWLTQR